MRMPIVPKTARARIIVANGTELLESAPAVSVNDRTLNEGGGVKVGRRVLVGTMLNCAARVGSIVEVGGGSGVGGGATTLNVPGETCTSGEYTHPLLFGAPGYSI
jgi:tetrahydrodipicolinate N-succinyltransferase